MMNKDQKINDNVFAEELGICKQQSNSKQCNWGKCVDCGVIPLLVKLNKGKLIETKNEIVEIKKSYGILE